jgi:hypothetical protein
VTAAKAKAKVWSGSPVLRRMLVPIEGLARADADPDRDRPDRDPPPDGVSELVLLYSQAHREQLEQWIKVVQKEKGIDGVSEAIYEACRIAAEQLHG